jgi:hypothetical protein
MNFTQKIASGFVGLSLLLMPGLKAGVEEDHKVLWNALEEVGVKLHLNDPEFCDAEQGVSGLYSPSHNVMIICQDGRIPISSREVGWTENDYDTMRHEAHHVVQDCVAGLENGNMESYFEDRDTYTEFVTNALTKDQFDSIVKSYREGGSSDEVVIHEVEAFAVASTIPPESIARTLVKMCN